MLVDLFSSLLSTYEKKPGVVASLGFIGVVGFGYLGWLPFMYISLFFGITGYIVYLRKHPKSKKGKR